MLHVRFQIQILNKESGENPLFLAERVWVENDERALPADLPKTYSKVDLLIGDVTHEGVLYKQLSIKVKKFKYKQDKTPGSQVGL